MAVTVPDANDDDVGSLLPGNLKAFGDKLKAFVRSDAAKLAFVGALFAGWYLTNIVFNIYNKQVLKAYPFPLTSTLCQFGAGAVFVCAMWASGAHKPPRDVDVKTLLPILPLALVHTLGNILTNVSLGKVAVSFTHTIKAMEPFFSVLLSSVFMGNIPSLAIVASLVPIVAGVALASMTEVSFNMAGFLAAMGSNVTFQSRNVLSKKLMGGGGGVETNTKRAMGNINLFSIITLMSFAITLPIAVAVEGVKFTPAAIAAAGVVEPSLVIQRAVIAGFCFHAYQQLSYMILQRVDPVTHSVGNCVKRIVVIIAAVVFFRNPVSPLNLAGTAVALAGVYGYTRVKMAETATKKKKGEIEGVSAGVARDAGENAVASAAAVRGPHCDVNAVVAPDGSARVELK